MGASRITITCLPWTGSPTGFPSTWTANSMPPAPLPIGRKVRRGFSTSRSSYRCISLWEATGPVLRITAPNSRSRCWWTTSGCTAARTNRYNQLLRRQLPRFSIVNHQSTILDCMTAQDSKKLLDAAEKSPEQVARAVMGLPAKVLQYKPAPDKWSVQEILAHLADSELVYGYRLRQAIADKEPTFAPIDQDAW